MSGPLPGAGLVLACGRIAWANLMQRRVRTLVATSGIAFAVFLMFLQIGFLDSVRRASTQIFELFDFDLALVAREYQFLYTVPAFDRIRLTQLATSDAVTGTFSLNVATARWLTPKSKRPSSLLLLGIDDKPGFVRRPAIRRGLATLDDDRMILADVYSSPDYGSLAPGAKGRIDKRDVTVAGQYALGPFFYADGSAIVLNGAFARLAERPSRQINYGLVKLRPGADAAATARAIAARLPDDVAVLTKDELIAQEQGYFVRVKPIGIMFRVGVLIALAVGVVVLFQVLSTEINNRLREYATLKAVGFGSGFVYGLGIVLTAVFAVFGYLPALALSQLVFARIRAASHLPIELTPSLLWSVAGLTLAMSLLSGLITLHRVRRADPAELF